MSDPLLLGRIADVVCAVVAQTLRDRGARRVALLDDGSPEAELLARMLDPLGAEALVRVRAEERRLESVLHAAGADPDDPDGTGSLEAHRLLVRLVPEAVPALAWNRTALLLGGELPPEPLLPLGDLYASEVAALAGAASLPARVERLVESAGGVERVDEALREHLEGRDDHALHRLPPEISAALAAGAPSRLAVRIVPKLGLRTIGLDLLA